MIYFKNRQVFGVIGKVIGAIFKFIYKIIDLFCLQLVIVVALIGGVLYFTGTIQEGDAGYIAVAFALIIAIVYAIIGTIKKCLGVSKKQKKEETVKIIDQTAEKPRKRFNKKQRIEQEQKEKLEVEEKPTYYRVKNNNNHVMAEFSDRYELYRIENGKLIKIRTDYK